MPSSMVAVGVADDGEVHEVLLRLVEEARALFAADGRQGAALHGGGTLAEAGEHRVDVEGLSHARTVLRATDQPSTVSDSRSGSTRTSPFLTFGRPSTVSLTPASGSG